MTVYVDDLFNIEHLHDVAPDVAKYGTVWCHMASDVSLEELHEFAKQIGLRRDWFQRHSVVNHYDLTPNKRELAVERGAVQVSVIGLVRRCGGVG